MLKQEQEKHHNAAMLYDKTREQLRRKEEQQRLEEEQRQKVELTIRNLELEKRTLINSMKQVALLCASCQAFTLVSSLLYLGLV